MTSKVVWGGAGVVAAIVSVSAAVLRFGDGTDRGADGRAASASAPGLATRFVGFDGTPATLESYAGTPLVVNFFASWCTACLVELPGIERVHQELGSSVAFIGLNVADEPAAGVAIIERAGITYDVARDPDGAVFAALGGVTMPTTVFIDADGRVVDVWSGELSERELRDRVGEVLL